MHPDSNLLKALLETPELSTLGTVEERAAFIALRIEKCTVRDAGNAIGVSKSHATNLADQFQEKLARKMRELSRKRTSSEYRKAYRDLYERLGELRTDYDDLPSPKIGRFIYDGGSKEDWAECTGIHPQFDDE
jgi:hypothetical protein